MTPDELRREGASILVRELGYADAARFIRMLRPGSGDYTTERAEMLGNPTIDELLEAAAKWVGATGD